MITGRIGLARFWNRLWPNKKQAGVGNRRIQVYNYISDFMSRQTRRTRVQAAWYGGQSRVSQLPHESQIQDTSWLFV